jgi:hypothetical protein
MPSGESSAERYQRLKVGNLEPSKRDHFRPDPVPFDRPLTAPWLTIDDEREESGVIIVDAQESTSVSK